MRDAACSLGRLLLAAVLACVAASVVRAAGAAPALRMSAPAAVHPAPDDARMQMLPAVAYDGADTLLVVWQQGMNHHGGDKADILAVRLDTTGRVRDEQPITVTRGEDSQERPTVVSVGGVFLVVWQDFGSGAQWAVRGARVGAGGERLDPDGFVIAQGGGGHAMPAVARLGDDALVVWQHYHADGFHRLQAALVDARGRVRSQGAIRFAGTVDHEWSRYTPGWGYGPLPLLAAPHDTDVVRGGEPVVAALGAEQEALLSWNDDTSWAPGNPGTTTRRFARLRLTPAGWQVSGVQRAPAVALGRSGGGFATGADANTLFAGWGVAGRGQRVATAVVFSRHGEILENPNDGFGRVVGSGWDTASMLALFSPALPIDGPVAAASAGGVFLVAAPGAVPSGAVQAFRIFGSRLDGEGRRRDGPDAWPVLHEAAVPVLNPALAGGRDFFLLVYEQDDGPGMHRVWAKLLTDVTRERDPER